MTNAEAVSKIINPLRLLKKDSHISRRSVLRLLRDTSKWLISQKLLDRTLQKETSLYSTIECFSFKKMEVKECNLIEFRRCNTLMKSTKKIPTPIFSRLGSSLYNITSIDGNFDFTITDLKQYSRNKKRSQSFEEDVYIYIGTDMHLYIPDHEIHELDFSLITMETEKLKECSSCAEEDCENPWEAKFICPDKLEKTVFDVVLQTLAGTYKSIIPDQNPNGIEGQ